MLEWVWTTVPTSPATFTYTLNVPQNSAGNRTVVSIVTFTQSGITGDILAKPDPLNIRNTLDRHSADFVP